MHKPLLLHIRHAYGHTYDWLMLVDTVSLSGFIPILFAHLFIWGGSPALASTSSDFLVLAGNTRTCRHNNE